jgi:hypothetical protein
VALSPEEKERFLRALEEDDEFLRRVRARVLTPELLRLPEEFAAFVAEVRAFIEATNRRLSALESDLAELKQDVGVLKEDVGVLKEDVGVLKEDVEVLKQDVGVLKGDVRVLKDDVRVLKDDVGTLKGDGFEERLRQHPLRYLRPLFSSVAKDTRLSYERVLQRAAERALPREDQLDLARADAIVEGRLEGGREDVFGVVESSWRAHSDDVERAARRAALIEGAGLAAVAVVVSREDPGAAVARRAEALGAGLIVGEEDRPRVEPRRVRPTAP